MASFITGALNFNPAGWTIFESLPGQTQPGPTTSEGPYRPPNWGQLPQKTLMSVTMSSGEAAAQGTGQTAQPTNYYFDAVLHVRHHQEVAITKHPVQTGAAISDHAYMQPAQVELEIGMSDAMDSFVSGQYSTVPSKSVSAFDTFQQIQALRVPITLTTRLKTYQNMLIANIEAPDDVRTGFGLRCYIRFQQIIPAQVSTQTFNVLQSQILQQPLSSRPMDSLLTNLGTKQSEVVPPALSQTHIDSAATTVPGATQWSSEFNSVFGALPQ